MFGNYRTSASNFKSFFSITRTIFSHSRSEQFWKQNTICLYSPHSSQEPTTCIWISLPNISWFLAGQGISIKKNKLLKGYWRGQKRGQKRDKKRTQAWRFWYNGWEEFQPCGAPRSPGRCTKDGWGAHSPGRTPQLSVVPWKLATEASLAVEVEAEAAMRAVETAAVRVTLASRPGSYSTSRNKLKNILLQKLYRPY